jgi:hypothetical protein
MTPRHGADARLVLEFLQLIEAEMAGREESDREPTPH